MKAILKNNKAYPQEPKMAATMSIKKSLPKKKPILLSMILIEFAKKKFTTLSRIY
jgi:hypothetical protein